MNFRVIETEMIFTGRVFRVRRDLVELPDGREARLDLVEHAGAVALVPVDGEGNLWFVRQYRHAAGESLLEIPAGLVEAGEDPETCAQREIREEIGMAAAHVRKIGEFFVAPGYSTELIQVYLATGLSPAPLEQDEDEFIDVEKIALQEAFDLARSGRVRDAKTLAALFLVAPYLKELAGK